MLKHHHVHVALYDLSVEERLATELPREVEIREVVVGLDMLAHGIDRVGQVVASAVLEESEIRVKERLGHGGEPLARHATCVDPLFPDKLKSEDLAKVQRVLDLRKVREGVLQDQFPPDTDLRGISGVVWVLMF